MVLLPLLLAPLFCLSQSKPDQRPPPLTPAEAERQGRALVADLLAQRPEKNTTNTGVLRIRPANDKTREIPVRIEIVTTPTRWWTTYTTLASTNAAGGCNLTVTHTAGQPNQYLLSQSAGRDAPPANPRKLTGDQTMVPFAGSDFWLADLGLEFLHWPQQRLLRKEMRKSQSCNLLESVDPHPAPGGYARVRAWIDIDNGGIVHADAYDARNQLLKQFDPTELKKVHGQRELEEMEMRNHQTGSHTWIKFSLPSE